ncbi:MAG: hypothetical protein JOS17DRAFT_786479 [Linnemannia elongata]|nr:MAG: hypothetical protein JOS17DRAFT_786479 [Linnemannia elongata]
MPKYSASVCGLRNQCQLAKPNQVSQRWCWDNTDTLLLVSRFGTRQTRQPTMNFFKKSNKNKTASAANTPAQTPAQTPRVSLEESRPVDMASKQQMKQAHDAEMLHNLMTKAMSGGRFGPYIL